jgi:hypothetical protein
MANITKIWIAANVASALAHAIAAPLLGTGLLIGSAQAGSAEEIPATPVTVLRSATQNAGAPSSGTTPASIAPVNYVDPTYGDVGFGWG